MSFRKRCRPRPGLVAALLCVCCAASQAAPLALDLPAQNLAASLRALAQRAGLSLQVDPAAHARAPAGASEQALPPVVITGEKIERDRSQTTTSVGVVNASRIEETGVTTFTDAFRLLGNVRDSDFVDSGILIRGINSEGVGGPAGRPLATVYIDGVAQTEQGVRRGASGLWDVEQVEVLRGPQSTTAGRNALAGALQVRTRDPTSTFEAAGQLRAGDRQLLAGALMLSGPITDEAAYRLVAERSRADGFVEYPLYAGLPKLDQRSRDDYWQVRGKLRWQSAPQDGVRVLLTHASAYDSPAYDDVDGPSAGVDWFARRWGAQTVPVFVEARSTRNASTALDVAVPLAAGWTLAAITTRVESRTDRSSVDRASVGLIRQQELAQEVRVNFDTLSLRAVAGVYVNREDYDDDRDQIRPFQPTVLRLDRRSGDVRNGAVFGEVNWRVGDVTWIGGARYDAESQRNNALSQRINTVTGAVTFSRATATSARYDAFLPKVGAILHLDVRQQAGVTVQRGYRAGGAGLDPITGELYEYAPEFAINYELSWRWQGAQRRWGVSANAFRMDWRDQQVEVPLIPGDFTSARIVSAGRSRVTGGELEIEARPLPPLSLFASVGLADTRFRQFSVAQGGQLRDFSGSSFPQAPKWSAAFGATYDSGTWFAGGDVKYTDRALSRSLFEGLPPDRMPAYAVLNLRAGFRREAFRLMLQANNVTDEKYFLYRYDDPALQVGTVGRGRTVSVVVDARI